MWITVANIGWGAAALLAAWMIYDWLRTDSSYSESVLTSSREGEIEAVAERHKI